MIRVLICDDDDYTVRMLEKIVSENPIIDEIVTFNDGEEVIGYIENNFIDIVLLDIDMPKLDGIETAKIIYDLWPNTKIIFVTAYQDFATDSFAVRPFDFILKPIDIEKVRDDINELATTLSKDNFNSLLSISNNILVKSDGDIYFIKIDDVFFVEKQDKLTLFHTKKGIYKTYANLHKIEKAFASCFYRVHRSYIANIYNIEKISSFSESSYTVHFNGYDKTALITKANYNIIKDSII